MRPVAYWYVPVFLVSTAILDYVRDRVETPTSLLLAAILYVIVTWVWDLASSTLRWRARRWS